MKAPERLGDADETALPAARLFGVYVALRLVING